MDVLVTSKVQQTERLYSLATAESLVTTVLIYKVTQYCNGIVYRDKNAFVYQDKNRNANNLSTAPALQKQMQNCNLR